MEVENIRDENEEFKFLYINSTCRIAASCRKP
jgi:hypothetical protein